MSYPARAEGLGKYDLPKRNVLFSPKLCMSETDIWLNSVSSSFVNRFSSTYEKQMKFFPRIRNINFICQRKLDLTDKMKRSFFQAAVVSILLYGCTIWRLTKRMEKKLDVNYKRMLWAILNKSWRQQSTKQQLYGHLPPITKTIKVRRTRHVGHCWRSRDELISDVLLWTPSHGRAKAGRPAALWG